MLRRILDSRWTYYSLIAILVLVAVSTQFELRIPSRPRGTIEDLRALQERQDLNVLFVVIDTLRSDRLSGYGYARETSAVIDDLARFGVRFAHVEAQSTWTKSSMASLWTGLTPPRTGITRYDHAIPEEAVLAAERFQEAGYRTHGVIRNGWVANNFGFGQGFELYFKPQPNRRPGQFQRNSPGTSALQGTDIDATEAALEFIRSAEDERFLLYVHYMDVHQYLYDQVAAELGYGTSYSDAYDSAIHWVDRNLGVLLLELEERDLFKRTLVVVTSDHGEEFYEHGSEGHAKSLYREVTEVPFVIGTPFRLDPGVVVEPLVRNVDVWPTILDLVGLPPLPGVDGRSLVPLVLAAAGDDTTSPSDGHAALAYLDRHWGQMRRKPRPLVSIREWPYRLVFWPSQDAGELQLYDHEADPSEQTNLADQDPERAAALRELAMRELEAEPPWSAHRVEIDEMRLNQLRALGYAIDPGEPAKEPDAP